MSDDVRRLEVNEVDFAYLERGAPEAPLALCLHGFPDHAPTFRGLLDALAAAGMHAVAPWMRGYAPTSIPADGRYETAALAMDALALVDALAPGRDAVLVGHDWGAAAAYGAAAYRPERFRRIVGMAVPPPAALAQSFLADPDQLHRSWYIFLFQLPLAEVAVSLNDFALIDKLWRDWSPGFAPPRGVMEEPKRTLASPGSLEAAIGYYRSMFDPSLNDPSLADVRAAASGPIPVPALYLHGRDDGALGAGLALREAMEPLFPAGLEHEILEGAGHFLHLERPADVQELVVRFVS